MNKFCIKKEFENRETDDSNEDTPSAKKANIVK